MHVPDARPTRRRGPPRAHRYGWDQPALAVAPGCRELARVSRPDRRAPSSLPSAARSETTASVIRLLLLLSLVLSATPEAAEWALTVVAPVSLEPAAQRI